MPKKMITKLNRRWQDLLLITVMTIIAAGFFSNHVHAQNAAGQEFSLRAAQKYAVEHSYDTQRSQLDILAAQKKRKETFLTGFPQLYSTVDYMNNLELATVLIPNFFEGKFDEKIPVQFGTQHNASVNFVLNQLVFNGSYIVGLKASKIYRQLADQNHERTQLDILEIVTNTYYLILVAEESERILNSNIENLEKTHYEIRERYKEGFVAETDADLVQISVIKLKNTLQTIVRQKEIGYQLLKFQMGLDLNEQIVLTDELEDIIQQIDISETGDTEFNLEQNIDYRLLETQEKLSEMALKNEKAQYYPTISAFYTFQWNAFRDEFTFFNFKEDWFRTQVLGLNISIPVFRSGVQKAKVAQAHIALEQAQNAKLQASQGLSVEAASAKSNLDSAYENYLNTMENVELSKKVYDTTLIKYNEGVASSLDLTQANDKYLAAQSDFIQAMSGLLTAKNKLDRLNSNYQIMLEKDK
ncbi:MAG: TolC family protein [Candidatus Aminicenantes bacterium]|nr:MAG: TolC family protein [Candidatus Aminicenantes bacterium]